MVMPIPVAGRLCARNPATVARTYTRLEDTGVATLHNGVAAATTLLRSRAEFYTLSRLFPPLPADRHGLGANDARSVLMPDDSDLTSARAAAEPAPELARRLVTCVDLTTLSGLDTERVVASLCARARATDSRPAVAAVCVYPRFVPLAAAELRGSGIQLASVATGFPDGQLPLTLRIAEAAWAAEAGAAEIDMVISRGHMIEGNEAVVREEIREVRAAIGDSHLKVILETGQLADPTRIARASRIAMEEGADFIKTSTGKSQPAATPEAVEIMCREIAHYVDETGRVVGIKPSGGIRDARAAASYFSLVETVLGAAWCTPSRLRFGASSLLDSLEAITGA